MLKDYKGLQHLKSMNIEELKVLCDDIRAEILEAVSKNGGHLASSLGVVELTVALHHVFDSPRDTIIWDVGHQAYAHKILTGRDISNIRTKEGMSGFPKPSESVHDPLVAGHAGISISEAAGIARMKPDNFSIAVIGDGSMTSGIAFEAMNHSGSLNLGNMIVILNDNEMSISKNVGVIANFVNSRIINTAYYQKVKAEIKTLLSSVPLQKKFNVDLVNLVKKIRASAVNFIAPDSFFEAFGFHYVGPFDGHDLEVLIKSLKNIPIGEGDDSQPLLIHVITKKGMGYAMAEDDPCVFHGIGSFDAKTGIATKNSKLPSFTNVFGEALLDIGKDNEKVVAITAAMKEGTGLNAFADNFPNRFFDVGIAEQHAITFAAGLAQAGSLPVVAMYSTFLQRSLDQVIHDIALNNLPVVICLDRAGLVGEDGSTHHGVFDYSYLRNIPNLTIMAPSSAKELRNMLWSSISKYKGPVIIRYPRGCVPSWEINEVNNSNFNEIELGKSRLIYNNNSSIDPLIIYAAGYSAYIAKVAAEEFVKTNPNVGIKVYDARFIKPLDKETILSEVLNCSGFITVEENMLSGGFGSAVLECVVDKYKTCDVPFYRIGIEDKFIEQGTQSELRAEARVDVQAVYDTIKEAIGKKVWTQVSENQNPIQH
ncbi:MAG: 1-deoxy-D-xylulose-5-phosphate synthase [bacterium]